ncbi:hypothetical protein ACN47E_004268 [Coniothyrium glycines]
MSLLLQRLTSPPAQKLQTLQPTSSTVRYTVSTRSIPETLPAIIAHYASITLRIIFGIATILLVWAKWAADPAYGYRLGFMHKPWIHLLMADTKEAALLSFLYSCKWAYLLPAATIVLYLVVRRGYIEESLTVLHGLGVQTSTSASTYLQPPATRFIPTLNIQDILIHEAFRGFEVRFYLAIVVKGEQDVVVVFPTLLPRRAILEEVWRGGRRCLWGSGGKKVQEEKGRNND